MALFLQQSGLYSQPCSKKRGLLPKATVIMSAAIGILSLSACETVPIKPVTQIPVTQQAANQEVSTQGTVSQNNVITEADYVNEDEMTSYPTEPYTIPKLPPSSDQTIIRVPTTVSPSAPTTPPSHSDLLERARQNSNLQNNSAVSNSSSLPAFQKLMANGMNELKSNQLTAAENSFTRAQRLDPKSSTVYFYLSQVAFKKNQPRKAESMARRGLSFTTDSNQRQALWQLILRSGQSQNNARVIKEAQQALR